MKDGEILVVDPDAHFGVPENIFTESDLDSWERLAYAVLKSFGPTVWASYTTIAKRMNCSRRKAILTIQAMEGKVWGIKVVRDGQKKTIHFKKRPTGARHAPASAQDAPATGARHAPYKTLTLITAESRNFRSTGKSRSRALRDQPKDPHNRLHTGDSKQLPTALRDVIDRVGKRIGLEQQP